MNDEQRRSTVVAIHGTATMLVLAVAGGGNAVITDLLAVPGASRTVLEIRVPYAQASLTDLVGDAASGAGAVSQAMAEAMASACLDRARTLDPDRSELLGVGITASLMTDRTKRGEHRAHVAVAGPNSMVHRLVSLEKGRLDRLAEDRAVADAALEAIALSCELP